MRHRLFRPGARPTADPAWHGHPAHVVRYGEEDTTRSRAGRPCYHRLFRDLAALSVAFVLAIAFGPPALGEPDDAGCPVIIKTKPVFLTDVLAQSDNHFACTIDEGDVVRVEVTGRDSARGFAYFDSAQLWRSEFGLARAADFDNDGETRRWKLVGGMSYEDKRSEFHPSTEGGAPLGSMGTGVIDVAVWHRVEGAVTKTVVPVRVGMQKLYVELDWFDGTFRKRVERGGETLTLSCKPVVDQKFIDAFGQCGLEVVVCDSPETGNTKNVIPADALFDKRRRFNCENLSSLVERRLRDETDAKALNEGTSVIARWLIDNGYVNLDPSRPDTVYMIGVQRWSKKRSALARTMGVVCLLEYEGTGNVASGAPGTHLEGGTSATGVSRLQRIPMAFIFSRSIAESTAAVNGDQKTQIPWTVAARHTAIHEIAAHCFPVEWNNNRADNLGDPYWNQWRYLYAGHPRRPEAQDDYYRIYQTCVTSTESGLDGAYYAFMGAPRLNDFRWRMANDVTEKTRDIIRDHAMTGQLPSYGYKANPKDQPTSVADSRDARE